MRLVWGLGFALVVLLGLWLGLRTSSEVEGKNSAGFLDVSGTSPAVGTQKPAVAGSATPTPAPVAKAASSPPSAAPEAARPTRIEEQLIAASVLHRPWSEVSVLVNQSALSDARKHLYLAFSAAVAGEMDRAKSFAEGLDKSDEIDARERALLASAMGGTLAAPVPASSAGESVGAIAMALTLRAKDAAQWLTAGRSADAARAYSEVLLADAQATWPSDHTALQRWSDGISRAQAGHRWSVKGNWPSFNATVKAGDSLTAIRQRAIKDHPDLLICTGQIERANQMKSEKAIHPGDVLRIPTDRAHMLVDISTRWVLYMMGDEVVMAWEGGVGKPGNETVPGQYKIGLKQKNPSWFKSGAAPVLFGNPENPLGTRWLSWQIDGVESHLGFHGTTDPSTVGGAVSSGCVRLRNEDVELLFEILPEKADVLVQP